MIGRYQDFLKSGWITFDHDPVLAAWGHKVYLTALNISQQQSEIDAWLRCAGTWYAGVNALPNNRAGAIMQTDVPPLSGKAVNFIKSYLAPQPFDYDPAQISICYPGYPAHGAEESEAAYRYRRNRFAAHVDGLHRTMPDRRRFLNETHGFILGIPLDDVPPSASPMVVWEGSHEVMRAMFKQQYAGIPPEKWSGVDITDAYVAARKYCFDNLPMVNLSAKPGMCYIVHRLALHGVGVWDGAPDASQRCVIYFRPDIWPDKSPQEWLLAP